MSLLDKAIKENCGCGDEGSNNLLTFLVRRNAAEEEESSEIRADTDTPVEGVVSMDIPLLIRMFEYMREEVKDDETIHRIAQKLSQLSVDEPLTMDNYEEIIG